MAKERPPLTPGDGDGGGLLRGPPEERLLTFFLLLPLSASVQEDTVTNTQTLTQQFAEQHAKDVVPAMLKTIRRAQLASKVILVGALGCSYVHQAHFLDHLGAGAFGWVLPLIFDLAMVAMLSVVKTVGMARDAKKAAAVVFALVALASGLINAAAPGPVGLRALFAFVVAVVIGVEWVAGKIRPDFAAIEAREAEATGAPAKASRKLDPEEAKRRAAKAAITRKANAAAKAAEEAARQRGERSAQRARAKAAREAMVQGELDLMVNGQ
jgi:hypothetical protein